MATSLRLLLLSSVVSIPAALRLSRRAICSGATTFSIMHTQSNPVWAALTTLATADAKVTSQVRLEFVEQISAEEQRILPVVIGLFGKDAPSAVSSFEKLCAGQLYVPCPTDVDLSGEVMERTKQSKKAALRGCQGSEANPVSYAYSQVWSVQRGRRIDAGAVQGKFALRVAPTSPPDESANLSHDAAGLLSVRRGGGSFDFGITTAPTPQDDQSYAVIGRVIEGMDSVAALDAMPVVKAADAFNVEATSASRAKACDYASPQPFCAQNKPLRKVTLIRTAVLS